ncbi:MAG: Orn/Lys/Arg family decarboxylase [Gaiellaceae bacterium]
MVGREARDPSSLPLQVLLMSAEVGTDTAVGRAIGALADELEALGVVVEVARSSEDAATVVAAEASLCVAVADWGLAASDDRVSEELVAAIRGRSEELPIFLMSRRGSLDDVPSEILRTSEGFVHVLDDTPGWIAGRIRDAALRFRRQVLPPMFESLVDFTETHEYSWHTPGHEGGAAFLKSAVGRAFFDFFGERTFRADLSVSVTELGSLLDHSGPIGEAERRAAQIFGADMTFFVTNGTSTSNRVVHQACVCAGDLIVLDRNAHKSTEQATTITHGVAVYMLPTRNHYGIIGPVPPEEMTGEAIARKIAESPIAAEGATPVLATITNSTYDGLLYHVPTIDGSLGAHIDRIHYDEAWYAYAAFNPLYRERFAMHAAERPADSPTTFATQSTHKLLAALSQASCLHVRNGRNPIDQPRLNEAFMMHASTSPLYAIIASNDVSAKMMEGRGGLVLTRESIDEAIAFRRTLTRVAHDLGDDWCFSCWQPDRVRGKPFLDADPEELAGDPEAWELRAGDAWHGFEGLPDGYAMLDPIKVTVLTPGMAGDGSLADFGVPAPLVSAHLDEHASIVVEKTQNYSILFLFSIGVTKGKWGSLVTALLACKRDIDENAPLEESLPATLAAYPERYAGMGLRDLAHEMHETMRELDYMERQREAFRSLPEPAMPNADAYTHVVRGTVDTVKLDEIAGRTTAVLVVPYPPGIPLLVPGERFGGDRDPFLRYLQALQEFDRRFPHFEHEIHGVEHVAGDYVIPCVR